MMVPYSEEWFNRQYDWILYVNADTLKDFLKYPSSSMNPITRLMVDLRFAPRPRVLKADLPLDRMKYEDLWFQKDGRPVGFKRYTNLLLLENEQGCIYVKPDPLVGDNVVAFTNAVVRLVLEVYARKSILANIIVPKDQFEAFASALGLYHFFKMTIVYPGGPGNNMSVHLITDPQGIERYFYYDDTGRR